MIKVSKNIISKSKIEKLVKENPDLTHKFIKSILISRQEVAAGKLEEYASGSNIQVQQ